MWWQYLPCFPIPEEEIRNSIWRKQGVSVASSLSPWDEKGSELHSVLHSIYILLNYIPPFQSACSEKGLEELSQHLVSPQPPVHMQL